MDWQFTPFVIPLLLSTVISSYLAVLVWRRRPAPGVSTFTLILVVAAAWTAGYAIELCAVNPSTKLFWSNVNFFATVFMPTAWLVFALEYTGKKPRLDWLDFALLSILPLITLALVWTSPSNHILFSSLTVETTPVYSAIDRSETTLYWIFTTYYYLLILTGTLLLFWDFLASPRAFWGQKLTLLVGVAVPTIANSLTLFGLSPFPALDLTPFAFTFFSLAVFWSLFGFRLFDLIPVARTAVIESMGDGLIVLDTQNRVADLNQAAVEMFSTSSKKLISKTIAEIPFPWPNQVLSQEKVPDSREEIAVGEGDERRFYELHLSSLYDPRGEYAGRLIVLHDIQDRKQAEEELRARERYLTQLNDITHTTLGSLDIQDMLRELARRLGELVSADGCQVILWDETSQKVIPSADFDPSSAASETSAPQPGELAMCESVIRAGRSLVAEDVYTSPYIRHESAAQSPEWSVLGVPLTANEQKLGAVLFSFQRPHHFTPQEIALCEQAAGQVALAVEHARLYMTERQRVRELNALHNATLALLDTLDIEKLLNHILAAALSAIPEAEMGTLTLVDPATGKLQVRSTMGYTEARVLNYTFLSGEGYPVTAVRQGKPLLIRDTQEEGIFSPAMELPGLRAVRSAIVVPLVLEEKVTGAISLDATRPNIFIDDDLRLLVSFAATATAAIHNAQLHAEVQQLAITDALTGLYNLRGLFELGRREVERARRFSRPLSALMLDIDHFKRVNDTWGHATGNQVLAFLGESCRKNVRDIDIAARYGGEEFAVLLPETDTESALQIAERLRCNVADTPVPTDHGLLPITISLGVAGVTERTQDLAALLKCADVALYAAKQAGRNCVMVN